MPKSSPSLQFLPAPALAALERLGADLAVARVRRMQSQREWAQRLGVSIPTLARLEKGDPSVGMGVYAAALWMIGKSKELGELASPTQDIGAIEQDIRRAKNVRAVRSRASVAARLSRSQKQVKKDADAGESSLGRGAGPSLQ